jgi:RNA polymerase sigma factor (TIGR02999 family)
MSDVTRILESIDAGDAQAAEKLLPLVYDELRNLAAAKMARETPGQTLDATALVHEAYLRLVANPGHKLGGESPPGLRPGFANRGHFFAAAAEAMRRILIERARHKRSLKGGGEFHRRDIDDIEPAVVDPDLDLLELDDVLTKLESQDQRKADLVKLRFFTGLTIEEAAEALGISESTANNDWAYARCWLRLEIEAAGDHDKS